MLRWAVTISMIAGAFALATTPAQAQQLASIGSISGIQPDAFGTPPGQTRRTLSIQTDVFSSERVETQKSAWAQIRFRDDTDLRVGGNSVVVLDKFVYDPQKKTGQLAINVTQGMFRFVTGTMNKDGYKIHTPSAVIGVRGTDFLLEVGANGTRVAVIDGMVEITPLRNGQMALVAPNSEGSVDNGGNSVTITPVPGDAAGSSERMTAWFDSDGSLGNGGDGPPSGLSGQAQIRTLQMSPTPPVITPPPPPPPPSTPPPQMYRKF